LHSADGLGARGRLRALLLALPLFFFGASQLLFRGLTRARPRLSFLFTHDTSGFDGAFLDAVWRQVFVPSALFIARTRWAIYRVLHLDALLAIRRLLREAIVAVNTQHVARGSQRCICHTALLIGWLVLWRFHVCSEQALNDQVVVVLLDSGIWPACSSNSDLASLRS